MKKTFDNEYSTQKVDEMKWLESQGIRYSFVKKINNVDTYKYTKTADLFKKLAVFYCNKDR